MLIQSFATVTAPPTIDYLQLAIGLAGGLAIFLLGLNQLTDALQASVGDQMRILLERMTSNRFAAVGSGIALTSLTQSSSVTTVLLVGFVSAALMTLQQSIGVILGAGIASTFTAQLIAFKVTKYALVLVALGFAISILAGRKKVKQYGLLILALGLIFFGMHIMSEATNPLRTSTTFIDLMSGLSNPWLGVLIGTIFTAIIQSSGATLGLILVLAGNGLISLDAGIAIAFGANIGTCATAILAAIGKPRSAHQVAAAHVLIKIIGVALWISFIPQLAEFVRSISPTYPQLDDLARSARETPRQIANAHTIFNLVNACIFIWFITPFRLLLEKILPAREEEIDLPIKAKYLDAALFRTPALALDRVRHETKRLGGYTLRDVDLAMRLALVSRTDDLDRLANDRGVVLLQTQIINYIRELRRLELTEVQSRRLEDLLIIGDYYASMAEIARLNLVAIGRERIKYGIVSSDETRRRIATLFDQTRAAIALANQAVENDDREIAERITKMKAQIEQTAGETMEQLSQRLLSDSPKRAEAFRVGTDSVAQAKRLYYYAKRIARIIRKGIERSTEDELDLDTPVDRGGGSDGNDGGGGPHLH